MTVTRIVRDHESSRRGRTPEMSQVTRNVGGSQYRRHHAVHTICIDVSLHTIEMLQAGQHERVAAGSGVRRLRGLWNAVLACGRPQSRLPSPSLSSSPAAGSTRHAQVAPNVPALEPSTARDLEGKVVREIRIAQGLRSTVDIVRRNASRQGMPFHHVTLLEDRRRLDALRLFSAIEIRPVAAGDEVASKST